MSEQVKSKLSSIEERYLRYIRSDRRQSCKRKQLKYFRKRYGPNINFEHLDNFKRV